MNRLLVLSLIMVIGFACSTASAMVVHGDGNVTFENPGSGDPGHDPAMVSDGITDGNWYTGDGGDADWGATLSEATYPVLTIDLGTEYGLTDLRAHAYGWGGGANGNCVNEVLLSFARSDGVFGDWTSEFAVELIGHETPQILSLGGTVIARYVKVKMLGSHDGGNWVGINEFAFEAIPLNAILISPADGADPVAVESELVWEGSPLYTSTKFDLTIRSDDPNFLDTANNTVVTDATSPIDPDLDYETTYYWRVDSYEPNGLGDDILRGGDIWSFTTTSPEPIITGDPQSQTVAVDGTAEFTVSGVNLDYYQWYKNGDELTGETAATLVVDLVQIGDEGLYTCTVGNNMTGTTDVTSEPAKLLMERLMAQWDFEGDLVDEVASIAGTFSGAAEAYSTDSIDGGQSYSFDAAADTIEMADPAYFDFAPQGLTVKAWIKTTSDSWPPYLTKGNSYMLSFSDTGYNSIRLMSAASEYWTGQVALAGLWHQTTATYSPVDGMFRLYVDGELEGEFAQVPPASAEALILGTNYVGLMDNVDIYNYAKDSMIIAQEYLTAVPTDVVCLNEVELWYDFDDDCDVDLADFATFAATWLNCNRVAGTESGLVDCL